MKRFLDNILHVRQAEERVAQIQQQTADTVSQTNKTLQQAGQLQKQVFEKTTTYYLGRAMGGVK